jgi:hypothetical protein
VTVCPPSHSTTQNEEGVTLEDMKVLDFPVERRTGDWLLEVHARDSGETLAIFVIDGSYDEVERLTQRIYTYRHAASAMPVQHLTVAEFEAEFGPILDHDKDPEPDS